METRVLLQEWVGSPMLAKANEIVEEYQQSAEFQNILYKTKHDSNKPLDYYRMKSVVNGQTQEKKVPLGDLIEELIKDLEDLGDSF